MVDLLERDVLMESVSVKINGLPYIQTMRSFKKVVERCFTVDLKPDYEEAIQEFKQDYLGLGVSITPKVHMLFQHVKEFLEIKNRERGEPVGLGLISEQAFECVHSDMKTMWDRVKVGSDHPNFGERLREFISAYNAKHV